MPYRCQTQTRRKPDGCQTGLVGQTRVVFGHQRADGGIGFQLGQIGIFAIFIAVLLFRPQGLFGAKA